MTKDNLNIVCCKGRYSVLKLSIHFIAAYFTGKSRSLRQNELKEFSAGLKRTTFWVYFSAPVVSFLVMLYVSCHPFGAQTDTSEMTCCNMPLPPACTQLDQWDQEMWWCLGTLPQVLASQNSALADLSAALAGDRHPA